MISQEKLDKIFGRTPSDKPSKADIAVVEALKEEHEQYKKSVEGEWT